MDSLVSIIVPYYKPQKLRFRKCIESLVSQGYVNIEILLVDDGNAADDNCVDIITEYAEKDKRVKLLHQDHLGVSSARNLGISESSGEYISFVDADDFVESNFIEELVKNLESAQLSICGISERLFPMVNNGADERVFFSQPSLHNGLQYINFCANKLFKKSIIDQNRIQFDVDVKLGEDALFLSEYLQYCHYIRCSDKQLYHYVESPKSAVNSYQRDFWLWEKQVIERQWALFHQFPLTNYQEMAMIHWLFHKFNGAINYYLWNESAKKAQLTAISSIISHPLYQKFKEYNWRREQIHFNKKERYVLRAWQKHGIAGMFFMKKMKEKNLSDMIKRLISWL